MIDERIRRTQKTVPDAYYNNSIFKPLGSPPSLDHAPKCENTFGKMYSRTLQSMVLKDNIQNICAVYFCYKIFINWVDNLIDH